ncbi:MAG: glycosyltransferase [Patescibacteria group bacterium]
MKLSVLILNYKTFYDLPAAIESLQKFPIKEGMEIIVVDNDSQQPDAEKEFLARFGADVKYIKAPHNLGFGGGNNLGAAQSTGEYIVIHNPDVRVWEGSLQRAVEFLDSHSDVGVIGGQLIFPDGIIQDSYRSFPSLPDQFIKRINLLRSHRGLRKRVSRYLMWEKDPHVTEPVDWVVGGFLFIRKNLFDALSGFDERFFLFMEDVDICRRAWEHGMQVIYYPQCKATHADERLSAGGIKDFFRKKTMRIHFMSAVKYFWKYKFTQHPRSPR